MCIGWVSMKWEWEWEWGGKEVTFLLLDSLSCSTFILHPPTVPIACTNAWGSVFFLRLFGFIHHNVHRFEHTSENKKLSIVINNSDCDEVRPVSNNNYQSFVFSPIEKAI